MSKKVILVCGGRDFNDERFVNHILDKANAERGIIAIIQGGAKGADSLAAKWAKANRIPCKAFHADWNLHGKAAGHIRNKQMLDEGKPDAVIAFPGGAGTANMVEQARNAGLPIWRPVHSGI
jgi:predicted Rossmann-fold nucleotide-binding protein